MDQDTIRALAHSSAQEAAQEVVNQVKADLRETLAEFRYEVREEIREELRAHFGGMEASQHIIQHDRIERLLKLVDRMGSNLVGKLVANLLLMLIGAGAVGYVLWQKLFGG